MGLVDKNIYPSVKFSPDKLHLVLCRFLKEESSNSEKFSYVPFGAGRQTHFVQRLEDIKSVFFGAGRHRCIGENFAYIQIKTIWSVLLRKYEFELVKGHFPPVNYSTMIHTPVKPIIAYKLRDKK